MVDKIIFNSREKKIFAEVDWFFYNSLATSPL